MLSSSDEYISAFHRRQEADFARHHHSSPQTPGIVRRKPFQQRYSSNIHRSAAAAAAAAAAASVETDTKPKEDGLEEYGEDQFEETAPARGNKGPQEDKGEEGEESWRNSGGENLADFGVDEDVEFYDDGVIVDNDDDECEDDDVPLGELIRRRRGTKVVN